MTTPISPLFTSPYYNQLYETMRYLDYDEILQLCNTNRQTRSFCQNSFLVNRLLISRKTDQYINNYGTPLQALIAASAQGNLNIVNELLRRGVNPTDNYLVFLGAIDKRRLNVVKRLLDAGVDPSIQNNYAINRAASEGDLNLVSLLLNHPKVDPGAKSNQAIINASMRGFTHIVRQLLSHSKVDPSVRDNEAIRLANRNGHDDIVALLLKDPRVYSSLDPVFCSKLESKLIQDQLLDQYDDFDFEFDEDFDEDLD